MGEVTQVLRQEHNTILFVLKILNRSVEAKAVGDSTTYASCKELVSFLQLYVEESHHSKEDCLLRALGECSVALCGDPVGGIIHEHEQARTLAARMSRALDATDINEFSNAAAQYSALVEGSIKNENSTLFNLADEVLDEDKQDELMENFIQIEKDVIGRELHSKMHDMISTWTAVFGV